MGTRADFYVGRGPESEWLGSIAWDGYPDGIEAELLQAETEPEFLSLLESFFDGREDVTRPKEGWPWPWDDSCTTDFAYSFDDGKVWASNFGHAWQPAAKFSGDAMEGPKITFPNMSEKKNVTFGKRSGLIVVQTK